MSIALPPPAPAGVSQTIADWLAWFLNLRLARWLAAISFGGALVILGASPRSTVVVLVVLLAIATSVLVAARVPVRAWLAQWPQVVAVFAFAGWGLASTLWSLDPVASIGKSLFLAGAVAATLVAIRSAPATPRAVLAAAVLGLVVGFVIELVGVASEILTDQKLARMVLQAFPALQQGTDKHVFISDGVVVRLSEAEISRRICVAVLFLWPLLYATYELLTGMWRRAAFAVVAIAVAVILLHGQHQSSQLAIVVSLLATALWRWSPRRAVQLVSIGWCLAVFLALPIAAAIHDAGLQENSSLFRSARHRVVIWSATVERIRASFWHGIGADATASARDAEVSAAGTKRTNDGEFERTVGRHAHDVFLQVWLELGAIGALLLALVGVSIMQAVSRLPARLGAVAFAQTILVAVMLTVSYGVWQVWLQSAIALSAIMLAMVHIVATNASAFAMPRRA
jgi:O-antigen ligase